MSDTPIGKVISFQSATTNISKEETTHLMEKVNNFCKQKGGFFAMTITNTKVEVRYEHPCGVSVVVGDSVAAASDAIADVMSRAQAIHDMFDEAVRLQFQGMQSLEKQVDKILESEPAKSESTVVPIKPTKH